MRSIYPHLELILSRSMSDLWLKLFVSTTTTKTQTCLLLQSRSFAGANKNNVCSRWRPSTTAATLRQMAAPPATLVGISRCWASEAQSELADGPNGTKRPWKKNTFEVEKQQRCEETQSSHSLHGTRTYISLHLPYEKQSKVGDSCSYSIHVWYISLLIYHTNSTIHG